MFGFMWMTTPIQTHIYLSLDLLSTRTLWTTVTRYTFPALLLTAHTLLLLLHTTSTYRHPSTLLQATYTLSMQDNDASYRSISFRNPQPVTKYFMDMIDDHKHLQWVSLSIFVFWESTDTPQRNKGGRHWSCWHWLLRVTMIRTNIVSALLSHYD